MNAIPAPLGARAGDPVGDPSAKPMRLVTPNQAFGVRPAGSDRRPNQGRSARFTVSIWSEA